MKKIGLALFLLFLALNGEAQSKFRVGPVYSIGASTLLGNGTKSGGNMSAQIDSKMGLKMSMGGALRAEYFFSEKWGVFLQTGFQQRGAIFKEYLDNYKPRYSLSYWDVIGGVALRSKGFSKNQEVLLNLGVTQHTLLSANRIYDTGSDVITSDIRRLDFGLFFGIGENVLVSSKDVFQVQLFATAGMIQPFSGNLALNGMRGQNFLTGMQVAYLFGHLGK